jgi:hypothetical protein
VPDAVTSRLGGDRANRSAGEIFMTTKPDVVHLKWAIDQRAKIQHTLLALYEYVRQSDRDQIDCAAERLLDPLIAAAFSLWRAVFLAENVREANSIHEAQDNFLATVLATNAINFPDDRRNSAWTVSYYLENAKHRIMTAHKFAETCSNEESLKVNEEALKNVYHLVRHKGVNGVQFTRWEWEGIHAALRILFKVLNPASQLPIEIPELPV